MGRTVLRFEFGKPRAVTNVNVTDLIQQPSRESYCPSEVPRLRYLSTADQWSSTQKPVLRELYSGLSKKTFGKVKLERLSLEKTMKEKP